MKKKCLTELLVDEIRCGEDWAKICGGIWDADTDIEPNEPAGIGEAENFL